MFTKIRKPITPPGKLFNRLSTQCAPSTPWNTKLNMVEPIKMYITKAASLVVDSKACTNNWKFKRPRTNAMIMAPTAPIAPPSVGVATPKKMVPNTKKISSRGGISTNVTRSAKRDSKPKRVILFREAKTKAKKVPAHSDTTMVSSVATWVTTSPLMKL